MVNFTLPSTTSEVISISTSQTFRSWVVIFHLRRPMACLSLNLIRYARACSSYECFILRARRLSSKLLKQGYIVERLKSSFKKFYGRYGDLIQQYKVTLSRMLNDILTLDKQWPSLANQTFHQFHDLNTELDLHRIISGFHGAFATGVASQQGNAYPSGHLVPSPLFGTCLCSNCWDQITRTCHVFTRLFTSNTPWYFLDCTLINFNTKNFDALKTLRINRSRP